MAENITPAPAPATKVQNNLETYNQVLDSVDKTQNTLDAKKTLNSIASVVIIIAATLIACIIIYKLGGKTIRKIFDWILSPFSKAVGQVKASNKTENSAILTNAEADDVADGLYGCFSTTHDNEEAFYNIINSRINNDADWYLVVARFGKRSCAKNKVLGKLVHNVQHTLPEMMQCNFNEKELKQCRSILQAKGVTKIEF